MTVWDQSEKAAWVAAVASGFAMWLRERRRSRRDANEFALRLIATQNERIDHLTLELGQLQGRVAQLSEQNIALTLENAELRAELNRTRKEL